jgi:hypothetical protein
MLGTIAQREDDLRLNRVINLGTTPSIDGGLMSWIILFFAGLFEVGWAVGLKYTDGFSRPLPTALTVAPWASALACWAWP